MARSLMHAAHVDSAGIAGELRGLCEKITGVRSVGGDEFSRLSNVLEDAMAVGQTSYVVKEPSMLPPDEEGQMLLNQAGLAVVPLEKYIRALDRVMSSASDILSVAEESGFDLTAIANAIRSHDAEMGTMYGSFVNTRDQVDAIAKSIGAKTRRAKGQGKKPAGSVDISKMGPDDVVADAQRIMKSLTPAIRSGAERGAFVLRNLREIADGNSGEAKQAIVNLIPAWMDFRDETYGIFGRIGGIVKRLNARAEMGDAE